jgi:hypothetical protein
MPSMKPSSRSSAQGAAVISRNGVTVRDTSIINVGSAFKSLERIVRCLNSAAPFVDNYRLGGICLLNKSCPFSGKVCNDKCPLYIIGTNQNTGEVKGDCVFIALGAMVHKQNELIGHLVYSNWRRKE